MKGRCDERLKTKRLELRNLHASHTLGIKNTKKTKYTLGFTTSLFFVFFFYESRKRDLKTRLTYEDRCDEKLKN
jgi:hypothetical protein